MLEHDDKVFGFLCVLMVLWCMLMWCLPKAWCCGAGADEDQQMFIIYRANRRRHGSAENRFRGLHHLGYGSMHSTSNVSAPTAADIEAALPSTQFRCREGETSDTGLVAETDCAICLEAFQEGQHVRVLPDCAHTFHTSCIDVWLAIWSAASCPFCRNVIAIRSSAADPALDVGNVFSGTPTPVSAAGGENAPSVPLVVVSDAPTPVSAAAGHSLAIIVQMRSPQQER